MCKRVARSLPSQLRSAAAADAAAAHSLTCAHVRSRTHARTHARIVTCVREFCLRGCRPLKAIDVYERMVSLYGRTEVGSQLTVDAMRTIASSGDPNYSALLRKMLGVISATRDVPYRVVRDAYTVAMKACNDSGDLGRTIELDKEFEACFAPHPIPSSASARAADAHAAASTTNSGRAADEGARPGDPSASAVALSVLVMEAAVRLRRVGPGMRHAKLLFSKPGMYMGSQHEYLVVHSGALQWGLNLLSLVQSNESAELAENVINAAYANGKRVSAVHCSLVLKACRGSFATASRVLERMKQEGQAITPNHASALISTAGAAGEGAAAFRLFRDLLGSRDARNVFTYNASIAACGRNGMLDEVEMLLEGMRKDGIAFDSCTYASVLQAYVIAGRYDLYIKTVRELYEDVNGNAINTNAEKRRELLEESTWVELIKGCALYPTGTELDDTGTTMVSRLQQLRRLDVIVGFLEAAVGSPRAASVAASCGAERKRVKEDDEDVLCSILADIHASSNSALRRQPLTGRLANVAIQTYCKLGDAKSAELLLESMGALGIRLSAKHVTALFIGLQSNGDLHSIVRLHSRIWGDDDDDENESDEEDDSLSPSPTTMTTMNRERGDNGAATTTASVQPLQLNAGFRPDLLLATVVLFAAVSIEDVRKCRQLLRTLLSMKVRLNEAAYKPALHACVISGDHKSARRVINMMMKDTSLDWDQQMYFHLLSALAMLRDADEAVNVMEHLYEKGLFDDTYSDSASNFHTLALKACRNAGRGELAMHLFQSMQKRQYRVENVHYTLTMLALIEVSNAEMIDQALKLHAEMEKSGIEADTMSVNAAIAACSRAGLWREALAYLDRFEKPVYPRSLSRDNGIIGEMRGDDDRNTSVHSIGSRSVLEPDVASYTSAMHACGNAGEWRRALELFDAMVDRGLMPDNVAFNCAIRACGMSPSQLNTSFGSEEEALEKANAIDTLIRRLTNDVRFSGNSIDDQMCTHVIQAYGNLGFLDRAFDWFSSRMDVLGVPRTDIVYTVMISACAMNGDWERAVGVMKSMHDPTGIRSGRGGRGGSVAPDAIREAFNAIRCSPPSRAVLPREEEGANGSLSLSIMTPMTRTPCTIEERTLDLVSWCEENGYTATSDFVYQMAMRVYKQTESVPAMCGLIERVLQQSIEMSSVEHGREREARTMTGVSPELLMIALHACKNASDLDTATDLLRRVTCNDENPCSFAQCCSVDVFNAALQSCERLGEADAARDIMRLMQERNVKPDHDSFASAIGSCGRDAATHYIYATQLFDTMQSTLSKDTNIDAVYKRLIGIFWRARQVPQILRLLDEAPTSAWKRRPWQLSSVPGDEGTSVMMVVAKIDLTEEESADVACALLIHALAQLHGDSRGDTNLRAQDIDGIEIWTGTSTGMPAYDGTAMGGNRSKHEHAMPATYYLLKDLGCPLPLVVIDTESGTTSSSMTSAGDKALANVECVRTKHGDDFRAWWQTFDAALVGTTTRA